MRLASGLALAALLAIGALVILIGNRPTDEVDLVTPDLSDVVVEEVTFESDDLELAGQLFRPDGEVLATAVIIQGSGESRRGNPWYLQVVDALTQAGVAVLLPDKRGSDGSEGDWRTSSFEALARDARVAMAVMRARYPDAPLTLIGMSQGGRIAPLAARGDDPPERVVSMSGGVLRAHRSLVFEEANTLRQVGIPRMIADRLAPLTAWHLREVRQPVFWAAVGDFDPLIHWAAIDMPALILLGGLDRQDNLDVDGAVERIGTLEGDNITVRVLENLDHALRQPGTQEIDRGVLDSLSGFVAGGRL